MKRTLAWLGIAAIVAIFAALVYCTATGASAGTIMAFMFCLIIIPVLIHGMILFTKMSDHKQDSADDAPADKAQKDQS